MKQANKSPKKYALLNRHLKIELPDSSCIFLRSLRLNTPGANDNLTLATLYLAQNAPVYFLYSNMHFHNRFFTSVLDPILFLF
ncbi:hypothetical protein ACJX0J_007725, partial [Zea mays]